tara:strand:- start:353 stop:808 length:456 start_codon:yes stop_codon:yes gene_type:complete
MTKVYLKKNFIKFENNFDFNSISELLDKNNITTSASSNYLNNFILNSSFVMKNVHTLKEFNNLYQGLDKQFNKKKKQSNIDMYFSFVSGSSSITHSDFEDVYIIGFFGKTVYKINNEEFNINKGDLLFIPKNITHQAISLSPRAILSYGTF